MTPTTPVMGDQAQATRPPRDDLFRSLLPGGVEVRDDEGGEGPIIFGHFGVFNRWTEIDSWFEGRFLERIAPGAFKKTLREGGQKLLFQHGRDREVGNMPIASIIEAREDETGGYYEGRLFDSIPSLLMEGLRAGVYGASFRFAVLREDFKQTPKPSVDNPQGLPERTIREARVLEFGPVTFGAYPEATAGVRSLTDHFTFERLANDEDALSRLIEFRNHSSVFVTRDVADEGRSDDEPGDEITMPDAERSDDDAPAAAETEDAPEAPADDERAEDDEKDTPAPPTDRAEAEPHPIDGRRDTYTPAADPGLAWVHGRSKEEVNPWLTA